MHIDIVSLIPTKSVGRREYAYAVVDDCTPNTFKSFQAAVENESGSRLCVVMTDNAHELSMGEVCNICEQHSIKLDTTVLY